MECDERYEIREPATDPARSGATPITEDEVLCEDCAEHVVLDEDQTREDVVARARWQVDTDNGDVASLCDDCYNEIVLPIPAKS